jgi:hypothetical protein
MLKKVVCPRFRSQLVINAQNVLIGSIITHRCVVESLAERVERKSEDAEEH